MPIVSPKITGHCSLCDKRVFDVLSVFEAHEIYPGEPKQIGAPTNEAVRMTFLLWDGCKMQLTFCADCADRLTTENYGYLWQRVVVSWVRELREDRPDWFMNQLNNGLLCTIGRESWQKIMQGENSHG